MMEEIRKTTIELMQACLDDSKQILLNKQAAHPMKDQYAWAGIPREPDIIQVAVGLFEARWQLLERSYSSLSGRRPEFCKWVRRFEDRWKGL